MRFAALGRFVIRARWWILGAALVFFVAAGGYGIDVASRLSSGGFSDPGSASAKASDYLTKTLGSGTPNVVVLVSPKAGSTVDDPTVVAAGVALTQELAAQPGVDQAVSYWMLGNAPPLRSATGSSALVLAQTSGDDEEVRQEVAVLTEKFSRDGDVVVTRVGGVSEAFREVTTTIEKDLRKAELLALPFTLLVLLFVFRSVVSAVLPLIVGALSIVGTMTVLKLLAGTTTVSIFALNLTTALGLGLAIDYSLLLVSRLREERAQGHSPHDAVVRTVVTAGRAVVFSGFTVAVSLGALLVFPVPFLRSFAYAGIGVVAMAVIAAVIVLPAMLAALGDRVNSLALHGRHLKESAGRPPEQSRWYRMAQFVMRRPVTIGVVLISLLLFVGTPILRLATGTADDRVLPSNAEARQVGDSLRTDYSSKDIAALAVVFPEGSPDDAALEAYAITLSNTEGVSRVDTATGVYVQGTKLTDAPLIVDRYRTAAGPWVSVVPSVEPLSPAGEKLTGDVRAVVAPVPALVGGTAPQLVDMKAAVVARLPWAVAVIALATFVLLFLSFGSVLVPIKALVLNTLSLSATFGAMVWIFQDGHFSGLLHFTPTGTLELTIPILMFCIAFGLSMDYEVFLLSRIKEERDRSGDNDRAVAVGLARTGRIITAAAATISIVFLALATSSISLIKLFGIGLTIAVLVDATLVRATLVPAFMKLAGDANWWAPRWMKRIYERAGMSEAAAEAVLDLTDSAVGARTTGDPSDEQAVGSATPA